MELDLLLSSIETEIGGFLSIGERGLLREFLDKKEPGLAVEYMCDMLVEWTFAIPLGLAQMILIASEKLNLPPEISWENVLVEDAANQVCGRLRIEYEDQEDSHPVERKAPRENPIREVFDKIKDRMEADKAAEIEEFLDYREFTLALDGFLYCLINDKTPISNEDLKKVLDVNMMGTILCTRAVGPYFLEKRKGKIINIVSNTIKF